MLYFPFDSKKLSELLFHSKKNSQNSYSVSEDHAASESLEKDSDSSVLPFTVIL